VHDELTITDDCTGLYNARHLNLILDTEIHVCAENNFQFSLAAITVEGVRKLENSIGLLNVNRLFVEVAQPIKAACPLIGLAFHYGNGEFLLLLPQTPKERASEITRQLRYSLVDATWLTQQGHNLRLKVSVGVVTFPEDGATKPALLHALDATMVIIRKANRHVPEAKAAPQRSGVAAPNALGSPVVPPSDPRSNRVVSPGGKGAKWPAVLYGAALVVALALVSLWPGHFTKWLFVALIVGLAAYFIVVSARSWHEVGHEIANVAGEIAIVFLGSMSFVYFTVLRPLFLLLLGLGVIYAVVRFVHWSWYH